MSWVLRSDRVLGDDGRFAPAAVRIEGAEIVSIDRGDEDDADTPFDPDEETVEVVDLGDRPVTPAFVNAHTHLALGFLRGASVREASAGDIVEEYFFRIEKGLRAEDVRAFVRMGAYESLLHGVAFCWDHYYFGEAVADGMTDAGMAGAVAPTVQDVAGPGVGRLDEQLEATERMHSDPARREQGIYAAYGPHATDTVSETLWGRLAALAERHRLPIHSHAAQSPREVHRALERHGTTPVDWLRSTGVLEAAPSSLLVHCLYARRSELEPLADLDVTLGFCPYAQRVFGFPADPRRWADCGLPWFVATDTSAGNDSMNLQKELRAVAELRTTPVSTSAPLTGFLDSNDGAEALAELTARVSEVADHREQEFERADDLATPSALLDRVWSIPGNLHPDVRVGVLEAGSLANLIVWDLDHPAFWPASSDESILQAIALGDTTGAMHGLMSAGNWIGRLGDVYGGLLESAELLEARLEASARRSELLSR